MGWKRITCNFGYYVKHPNLLKRKLSKYPNQNQNEWWLKSKLNISWSIDLMLYKEQHSKSVYLIHCISTNIYLHLIENHFYHGEISKILYWLLGKERWLCWTVIFLYVLCRKNWMQANYKSQLIPHSFPILSFTHFNASQLSHHVCSSNFSLLLINCCFWDLSQQGNLWVNNTNVQ